MLRPHSSQIEEDKALIISMGASMIKAKAELDATRQLLSQYEGNDLAGAIAKLLGELSKRLDVKYAIAVAEGAIADQSPPPPQTPDNTPANSPR